MHIFILGGSGRTGQVTIDECLRRGHTVTALVRKSTSLIARSGLTIVEGMNAEKNYSKLSLTVPGNPLNKPDIEAAFGSATVKPAIAISTLASVRATDGLWAPMVSPPRLMADSAANLVAVIKELNLVDTTKVVILSAAGVGESWSTIPLVLKAVIHHSNVKLSFDDHNLLENEIKASGVNYVLAKPTMLSDDGPKPIKHYGENGKGYGMTSKTSRKSVAWFLLEAAEKNDWDRTTPVIAN
ncbi:uncharacterized protein BP5553_02282 [Venustampulla echinocandica]|uniref:NAD(P)-binding domain-containing protein n=1 Tax=Venustampulla echinocandica TaxID=2656787 RepID=A0A370U3I3_9HELO|nr:uncharacterized protein BP5553_02282 [Venustampulla echinocandica]RDL42303.1 hypothetical protein BP5553_02282 [Venustampulla echinocandica]